MGGPRAPATTEGDGAERLDTPMGDGDQVPAAQRVLYALPSFPASVAMLPLALFLPAFYSADLGVPLAQVGLAIAASRLLDLVTDPLIGSLGDHLPTRFGRRKPWMVAGTPIFLLALWRLFVPPEGADGVYLLVWSAVLYLGFTMIDLPYKSWGAELSTSYEERSRIAGWREAFGAAGQVTLLAVLVVLGTRGLTASGDQLRAVALAVVVSTPLLVLAAVATVPERAAESWRATSLGPREAFRLIARNPALLRMVGAVLLFVSGVVLQGTLHRLILADVVGAESRFAWMLLVENLAALAAVPFWVSWSDRIGKHRALAAAALWLALWSLPLTQIGAGDEVWLIACIAIRGSSFVSIVLLANSIAADVVDLDTAASGRQRTGLFFAVWGMVTKGALAAGVALGTLLPAAIGYQPGAEGLSDATRQTLTWIYGGVPALLMGAGACCLWNFPITRERHSEVRAEIEARQRG